MFINNNHIANQLYVPYTKTIRSLGRTARSLATGEKIPTSSDGAGEIGVVDAWRQVSKGTGKLIAGMQNANSYLATQDQVLSTATDIIQRMTELTAASLDSSKNTADRLALDTEFQALEVELRDLSDKAYNGVSLFGRALSVRFDITASGASTLVSLSVIDLWSLSFGLDILSIGAAQSTLNSLTARLGSLNVMKAKSGQKVNEIERTIDFTRDHINNLSEAENVVRNIDVARETGEFTKKQVILSAAQSVLSQANGLVQSALQFFGG